MVLEFIDTSTKGEMCGDDEDCNMLSYCQDRVAPQVRAGKCSTATSDSSSLSSSFVLATLREAHGESKEAQRGIFRIVVNREAKS